MRFFKYQATGNDFIVVDDPLCSPEKAVSLCDRHFGIGADGLLLHRPSSSDADAKMIVVNPDGSIAEMCGNGLRCFVRYLAQQHHVTASRLRIETGKGILSCLAEQESDRFWVTTELGGFSYLSDMKGERIFARPLLFGKKVFSAFGIDMGNPHLVLCGPFSDTEEARRAAVTFQETELFSGPLNVESLVAVDRIARQVSLVVNERGVGFTLGCGTGGAATAAALFASGVIHSDEEWAMLFPGGTIRYRISPEGSITMRGDAVFVFSGEVDVR